MDNKILREKEITLYSGLFLMFFSVVGVENRRLIKRITRSVKRLTSTSRSTYKKENDYGKWYYYVSVANEAITDARDMTTGIGMTLKINPADVLKVLHKISPDVLDNINITEKDLNLLSKSYKDLNLTYTTVRYVNRFLKAIDNIKLYENLTEEELKYYVK